MPDELRKDKSHPGDLARLFRDLDTAYSGLGLVLGDPATSQTGTSSANASQTVTRAAVAGKRHYITGFEVVITGNTAGADIFVNLKDGSTTVYSTAIGSGAARGERVGGQLTYPIKMSVNTAANLEVTAGGTGVVSVASLTAVTV